MESSNSSPKKSNSENWTPNPSVQKILDDQGVDFCRALDLSSPNFFSQDMKKWEDWILSGSHADMHFMELNSEARKDPSKVLAGVRSALVFLIPYATGAATRNPTPNPATEIVSRREERGERRVHETYTSELSDAATPKELSGRVSRNASLDQMHNPTLTQPAADASLALSLISRYARGKDYHKVIAKLLNATAQQISQESNLPPDTQFRVVVDSIPFFDRAAARESGLGFVGKNTMLIRPGIGSFFFVATLLTTAPIEKIALKSPVTDPTLRISSLDCSTCRLCLDACPTQALGPEYHLDANKCLSYLTIEHRDTIPSKYWTHLKETIYGCDICQTVCPYNFKTLDLRRVSELSKPNPHLLELSVEQLARMDQQDYEKWFGGTAMTRAKLGGLVRNALLHLAVVDIEMALAIAKDRQSDPIELIRNTASQILGCLGLTAL